MRTADRIFYLGGATLGVVWILLGVGQVLIGLGAGGSLDLQGWNWYVRIGVFQSVLGAGWLVWWVVNRQSGVRESVE